MTTEIVTNLDAALVQVCAEGAALVQNALDHSFLHHLQDEVRSAPLKAWPQQIGRVRQRMDGYFVRPPFRGFPAVAELASALRGAARSSDVHGLRTWRPNEVSVQRYVPGPLAIEPHRDNARYRRLVAVFTTAGRARFRTLAGRHGPTKSEWIPRAGDLVLLRAPGLGRMRDGRLNHTVDAPDAGERWSVSFRMDTRNAQPERHLLEVS